MKSGNAQLQRQREHSGQTAGKLNALLVTFLTLFGWLFVACGTTTTTETTSATGTRCPDAVKQLVDPKVIPDLEISLAVDGSGSFMGDRTASRAFVAQQVALTVEDAVDKGAALRVIVFEARPEARALLSSARYGRALPQRLLGQRSLPTSSRWPAIKSGWRSATDARPWRDRGRRWSAATSVSLMRHR
jgi:hypothetical protein